jgi:hypothetical protein
MPQTPNWNILRHGLRFNFGGGGTANQRTNAIQNRAWKQRRPIPGEIDYTIHTLYPIDVDAGEHFMRLRTGVDYFPHPPRIGAMQEFMAQADLWIWFNMYRKAAVGPGTGQMLYWTQGMGGIPVPVANLQNQMSIPGLSKQA